MCLLASSASSLCERHVANFWRFAAGTEWEVLEKSVDDLSPPERAGAGEHTASVHPATGNVIVDEATGHKLEVQGAHGRKPL